jgi:hypothetical protein
MKIICFILCSLFFLGCGDEKMVELETLHHNGHTYIRLNNHWNHAGDSFVHDPDCFCLKKDRM